MAKIQVIAPAGAATAIALPKTNNVLSKIELYKILPILGTLYGGNSKVKLDGIPFNKVFDKIYDTNNVIPIPITIIIAIAKACIRELVKTLVAVAKNIVAIAIRVGNLPLHGTKLLVNIAIILSLGDSIILHPTTPAALHPNPIHIERHCFPWAHAFLNKWSILKATLGRYPKSSSNVNSGKNIKGRDFSKTIFQTNLEAARECGRQIKLRNLSGIILIDFIDLREEYQKPKIIEELRKALKEDKGNVKVYPFTELGLIQISRKRKGKSIYEYLEEPCKICKSNGFLLKRSYIENLIRNEIIKCSRENSIKDFYIEIDKNYEQDITGDLFNFIKNIEGLDKEIYLNFAYDIEGYKIEPLIFSNQKENYQHYKIKTIEKVW